MRNPERIPKVIETIRKYWEKHPDLRLGQIIGNVLEAERDAYYLEDDELMKRIKEMDQ